MAHFVTDWLKLDAITADLNGRDMPGEVRDTCLLAIKRAGKDQEGRDPKFSVNVHDDDGGIVQIIANVMARPGDHWPEEGPFAQ